MKKKIVIIGASGTIGKKIREAFTTSEFEIVPVTKDQSPYCVNMENAHEIQDLFQKIGRFDALICAAGDVALAPLNELNADHWKVSLQSKLLGQVNLAQTSLPFLNDKGSITLVSGIASEYPIPGGISATVANRAVEAFVFAAAPEMPRGIRINVVSPNMLKESEHIFGPFFPGMTAVPGAEVAQAFKKSVLGIQTGQIFRVH